MARDFYPTFKAFLGLHPELCLYRAEELTRAATPPEQESSRVDPKFIATVKALYSRAQSAAIYRIIDALEAQAPAPEPAQPPTEQGPTRGDLADLLDDLANETALSGTLAYRHAAQLVRTSGSRIDVDPPEKEGLITPPHGEARGRDSAAPTEQGDLAARFEALADLALKKCEEECLSDGAPNPFREEMAQAKAYRYAAELARDYAHTHSGTAARVSEQDAKAIAEGRIAVTGAAMFYREQGEAGKFPHGIESADRMDALVEATGRLLETRALDPTPDSEAEGSR